jgi:NAD(P)-dependent dehydrogenase (short-subunit alcohol dehydrogenase family)
VLNQFIGDGIASLEQLHEHVSGADLQAAVKLLGAAQQIWGCCPSRLPSARTPAFAAKRLPLGRSVETEDVGRAVLYLSGAGAVTGVALPVSGGEGIR